MPGPRLQCYTLLLMCWGGVVDMRERLSRSRNAARIHSPPWPCCWLLHCPAGCGAPAVFRRGYWPLLLCRSPPGEGGRGRSPGGRKTPKGAASGTPLKARLCRAQAAAPEERGQAAQRRSGAPQRAGRGEGDPPRRAGDSRQPGASPEGRKGKRKRARRRPQGEPTKPRINCRAIARLPLGRLAEPSRPRAAARGRSEAAGAGRAPE